MAAAHVSTWLAAKSKVPARRAEGSPPYARYEVVYVNTIVPARALDERPYGVIR